MIFKKTVLLQKNINKQLGRDLVQIYRRSLNILEAEDDIQKNNIQGLPDPAIFKIDFEKTLYKKLINIKKDLNSIKIENDYSSQLLILSSVKKELSEFFENVIVNDYDVMLKKNRLELLKLLCNIYDNYINFTKIEILE